MGGAFEEKLRSTFETYTLEDARLVGEVRLLFASERDRLFSRPEEDGLALCRRLAEIVDQVIAVYLAKIPAARGLAFLALGGYGRGELNPYSDVDVLILYPDKAGERASEVAGPLLSYLWDLGFVVGHATRSPVECAEAMDKDLPSATAMLEGRFLTGSKALYRKLVEEVTDPWLMRRGEDFIGRKIEEMRTRHRFYGDSVRLCNPNVKESPGGLRDMHVAGWIGMALSRRKDFRLFREVGLLTEEDSDRLVRAYGRILDIRNALHLGASAKQDVLDPATRPRTAEILRLRDGVGLRAAEHLMRSYYRAGEVLHRFLLRVVRYQEGCKTEPVRRRLGGGMWEVGGEICPSGDEDWTPDRVLEVVGVVADRGALPSPELIEAASDAALRIDHEVRCDPGTGARFLVLLGARAAATGIRALDRSGFLAEYLPEFGAVAGLIRDDAYHQYTVDEHTLRALDHLDRLAEEDPTREQYLRAGRPALLRLAILLHDVGKVRGEGHVERAVAMVPEIARRMGIDEEDARFLRFLVAHHSLISELSDHRLVADSAEELAELMPSREHLRCLYLLSLADVAAVAEGALSGWRAAQIRRLFEAALTRLTAGKTASYPELVAAAAGDRHSSEDVRAHLGGMGARYALEVAPDRAAEHLDLISRLDGNQVVLTAEPENGFEEVWIALRDRPGVFAQIAGVLYLHGLDIQAAQIYTRGDGIALDGFHVISTQGADADRAHSWTEVEADLSRALAGDLDLLAELDRRKSRFRPTPPPAPPDLPLGASASNRISVDYSVVEISALDRPALLHDLARAMSLRGLSIHHAVVATRGVVVADTFYVTHENGLRPDEGELDLLCAQLTALVVEGG